MDVLKRIEELRRRKHNVKPRELEKLAEDADWIYKRTTGSHAMYLKEGFRANLPIPRHPSIRGSLVLRILDVIEASVIEAEDEDDG